MNCEKAPTGKPSEDRRWMQYYPEMMLKMIQKPECTLWEYLEQHCPGPDVVAIHYFVISCFAIEKSSDGGALCSRHYWIS